MLVFRCNGQRRLSCCICTFQAQDSAVDKGLQNQQLAGFCSCMHGAVRAICVKSFLAPCSIRMNTNRFVGLHTLLQSPFSEFSVSMKSSDVEGYPLLVPE